MKSTRCVGFEVQDDRYPPDPDEPDFVLALRGGDDGKC